MGEELGFGAGGSLADPRERPPWQIKAYFALQCALFLAYRFLGFNNTLGAWMFAIAFEALIFLGVWRGWRPMWILIIFGAGFNLVFTVLPDPGLARIRHLTIYRAIDGIGTLLLLLPQPSRDWFFKRHRKDRTSDVGGGKGRGLIYLLIGLVVAMFLLTVCAFLAAGNAPR
jgi:hypothetical protein